MPEKRKSAFIRATQEAQTGTSTTTDTVTPSEGVTVEPSNLDSKLESAPHREASTEPKKDKKVTVYLTQAQEDKLDGLEVAFYQEHKRKVNRIQIIRYLIDQCNIDNLQGL